MTSNHARQRILKFVFAIGLILLLILAGIQVYLTYYLDDFVKNKLTDTVSEKTMDQYQLDIGELNLAVWNRKMELNQVSLYPNDSTSTLPRLDLDQFSIYGIRFLPYLLNGTVNLGNVQLNNPVFTFTENSPDSLIFLNPSKQTTSETKPRDISIDHFTVNGASVTYQIHNESRSRSELHNFDLVISDVRADSTTSVRPPYFDFESIETSAGNFRYAFKNDLYSIESGNIQYSTSDRVASIDSLSLIPEHPRYEFARQIGHQKSRISLDVDRLELNKPDLDALISGQFLAEKLSIQKANLDVFKSKLLPDDPDHPKTFPHVAFKNLNIPISIDTVAISQSQISYSQHKPGIERVGQVTFNDINAGIANLSNDSTRIDEGLEITLDVTSNVMDTALLDAHFQFPMQENGAHTARGTLASMQVRDLNPVLEPLGLVRAESGNIHALQFFMNLGSDSASGWTQLVYDDLTVSVLDSDNANRGGSQRFKSFLANLIKVKSDNIKEPFRRGEVIYEREPTKSMFSYWWQSLSTGLKDNVGL